VNEEERAREGGEEEEEHVQKFSFVWRELLRASSDEIEPLDRGRVDPFEMHAMTLNTIRPHDDDGGCTRRK